MRYESMHREGFLSYGMESKILAAFLVAVLMFTASYARNANAGALDKFVPLENTVENVIVKPMKGGGLAIFAATGYRCSTENGVCICTGGEFSEDCTAMRDNICRPDEELDCYPLTDTCTCSWGTGPQGTGGLTGEADIETPF